MYMRIWQLTSVVFYVEAQHLNQTKDLLRGAVYRNAYVYVQESCMYTHVCVHVCARVYCMNVCVHVCACVQYVYMCMCTCVCVCVHVYVCVNVPLRYIYCTFMAAWSTACGPTFT